MPLTASRPRTAPTDLARDAVRLLLEQHRAARLDQIKAYTFGPALPADPVVRHDALAAARLTLAEIDLALTRLEEGTYGSCAGCSRRIPAGRLLTRPYARYCARCDDET